MHDENPVCHGPGQIEVMGNEQAGYAVMLAYAAYQACDFIADGGVESTGHFIADEQLRLYEEAAEQSRSLAFAAAYFMGVAPDDISRQMDFFHILLEHFWCNRKVIIANSGQNAFFQCKPGMERTVGMLKDHLYVMVQILSFFFLNMGDILIVKEDMATVCPGKLTDDAAERTFSAAAFTGHSENFTGGQRERQMIYGSKTMTVMSIGFCQILYFKKHGLILS